jgi:hypothetical protein
MFRHGLLLSLIAIGSAIQLHAETGVGAFVSRFDLAQGVTGI